MLKPGLIGSLHHPAPDPKQKGSLQRRLWEWLVAASCLRCAGEKDCKKDVVDGYARTVCVCMLLRIVFFCVDVE